MFTCDKVDDSIQSDVPTVPRKMVILILKYFSKKGRIYKLAQFPFLQFLTKL